MAPEIGKHWLGIYWLQPGALKYGHLFNPHRVVGPVNFRDIEFLTS